jgi:hypothetical protein
MAYTESGDVVKDPIKNAQSEDLLRTALSVIRHALHAVLVAQDFPIPSTLVSVHYNHTDVHFLMRPPRIHFG